ncbi:hypothetical protein [Streptomyces sp. NPDC005017]|uniref:hypothetical protein n=1 Tax=Streptomyces sp. NPDC005017 TaxID=3364706 RepID=UPI0036756631
MRELGREIALRSPASAVYHLTPLEQRGALVRDGRGRNTCVWPDDERRQPTAPGLLVPSFFFSSSLAVFTWSVSMKRLSVTSRPKSA